MTIKSGSQPGENTKEDIGKKEARFLERMEAHKGMLYKLCRIYQDQAGDQQDLMQEMLLQLWTSYDSFRGESQFSSWMYRVALNTAMVYFRKERRRQHFPGGPGYPGNKDVPAGSMAPKWAGSPPYPDLVETPETVHDAKERLTVFYRAVQQLGRLEKALIFLYLEGQSGKEIAAILGITPANVRVRVNRVKDRLQFIIKTMGYEF